MGKDTEKKSKVDESDEESLFDSSNDSLKICDITLGTLDKKKIITKRKNIDEKIEDVVESKGALFDFTGKNQKFKGCVEDMLVINGVYWFKGIIITTMYGYKDKKRAILIHVSKENKISYKKLKSIEASVGDKSSPIEKVHMSKQNTLYINHAGLFELTMSSTKEEAREFKKFVTNILQRWAPKQIEDPSTNFNS